MNCKYLLFIILCVFLATSSSGRANGVNNLDDPCGFNFEIEFDIRPASNTEQIILDAAIPATIPYRQSIYDLSFSIKPLKVQTINTRRYARFFLNKPLEDTKITIKGRAKLYKYDLITSMNSRKNDPCKPIDLEEYLKNEPHLNLDSEEIKKKAKELKSPSQLQTIGNIHQFITQNLQYSYSSSDRSATWALKHKMGDCDEYSALFAALCRTNGIPAKRISGFTVKWKNTPAHTWIEVFLDNYGWVPFDPTHNHSHRHRASVLEKKYLYISDTISDPMLRNLKYYSYQFWGNKPQITMNFSASNSN